MSNAYAAPASTTELDRVEPEHPVAGPQPEPPPLADGDEFVSVYSAGSVVEAQMLTELLHSEGIPTPGFNHLTGAQVGAGMLPDEHLIRAPASKREQARALIDTFLSAEAEALPPEAGEEEPIDRPPRSPVVRVIAWALLAPMLLWLALSALTYLVHFFRY